MQIKPIVIDDIGISGLKLTFGEGMINIEITGNPMVDNRDFYFNEDGTFDGTGTYIGGEEQTEEEEMSGNGTGKETMSKKKLPRIEQMEILVDHANAAFKMLEVLMWDDSIEDADVRWRVDSLAGALAMIGNEITGAFYAMKNEEEEGTDVSEENVVPG